MTDETLIFLHVPKTGGTTLQSILRERYPGDRIYTTNGEDVWESLQALRDLPDERKANLDVVMGHMAYGVHEWLPGDATYVTLLRDPVDRVVSHYHYAKANESHYLYDRIHAEGWTLSDYVREGPADEVVNGQTKMLLDLDAVRPKGEVTCNADAFEQVKENLRNHFTVVGMTGRFDESVLLMEEELGWNDAYYHRENVTSNRPSVSDIDDETVETVASHNEYDLRLIDYVEDVMSSQVEEHGIGNDLALQRFRLMNKIVGPIRKARTRLSRRP